MYKAQPTILIVDDDAFFRELVVRLLTPLNYRVLEARTVADAIHALAQGPNLALIDYRMPGVDGATFIKNLREQGYKLPIVFCSGSGVDQKTFASMRNVYQVNLIIKKPIQPESFVQLIAELLPNGQDQQQEEQEEQEEQNQQESYEIPETEQQAQPVAESTVSSEMTAMEETDDAIAELAKQYLSEVPETLDQLRLEMIMAAAQNNTGLLTVASNRAHQIRGTAGSLGFDRLSEFGGQLEHQINDLISEELTDENNKWESISQIIDQAVRWTQNQLSDPRLNEPPLNDPKLNEEEQSPDLDSCDYFVVEEIAPTPAAVLRLTAPRVLVVEFCVENAEQITSILEAENIVVRTVCGAMEAFAVTDDFQPDAVMLQMAMPGLSGVDMCRMIRCNSRWQAMPVIMLTESLTAITRHALFEAGATDFVLTPIIKAELKLRVNTHLQPVMGYAVTV